MIATLLDRLDLRSPFETIHGCSLTPDGLARRKPDPRNVEDAMVSLEATSALYVGDRAIDVEAAHNAGIDAALLVRDRGRDDGQLAETDTDHEPEYRLSSLAQLPEIVR